MWERRLWRSEERYLELFRPSGGARILGEASTNYTKLPLTPGVPERIAAFNPEARFIYLLRDPIQRAVSHYWHMVRHHAEYRPIADAFRRDPQFVAVSDYMTQLRAFLDRFDRDRIAVLVHERLVGRPLRFRRTRECGSGHDQHSRLARHSAAAEPDAGNAKRHPANAGDRPPVAAQPDHAGCAPT
jgi:hypothetical protein